MKKSQIKAKCKEILNTKEVGCQINEFSADFGFLIDVFKEHSEWEEKSKHGVELITIFIAKPYNTKCFKIIGANGYETDISYIHAIDGPKPKTSDVKCAMRSAVRLEIERFKSKLNFNNLYCPFTAEKLNHKNTHIDHFEITFDDLANLFVKEYGIDALYDNVNKNHVANETEVRFLDKEIINEFIEWHNYHCTLRAVSVTANLSILRKGVKNG